MISDIDITTHTMRTLLAMLEMRLIAACDLAAQAVDAIDHATSRNQAIGTLLPMKAELAFAQSLYDAVLTLHRMPGWEKGGTQ